MFAFVREECLWVTVGDLARVKGPRAEAAMQAEEVLAACRKCLPPGVPKKQVIMALAALDCNVGRWVLEKQHSSQVRFDQPTDVALVFLQEGLVQYSSTARCVQYYTGRYSTVLQYSTQ